MRESIQSFLWLSREGFEFILFPPFLIASVAALAVIAFMCARQRPIRGGLWLKSYWLVFTQMLFYPAVLAVAVLGGVNVVPPRAPNHTASLYADVLWWTSLGLAAFWVWRMKRLRWLALGLVTLQQTLLEGAFLVAGMAISGRWL
jgi:hypothetical protein